MLDIFRMAFAPIPLRGTSLALPSAGEFGFGLTVVVTVVAFIFWRKRHELPATILETRLEPDGNLRTESISG